MTKLSVLASSSLLFGLLTACGGGSNDHAENTPPTVVGTDLPVAVTTDTAAVVSFAKDQLANTSEATDPLVLGSAMLAIDDAAEPAPV